MIKEVKTGLTGSQSTPDVPVSFRVTPGQKEKFDVNCKGYRPKKCTLTAMLRERGLIAVNAWDELPQVNCAALVISSYDSGKVNQLGYMIKGLADYSIVNGWDQEPKRGDFWILESDILKLLTLTNFED